jgi:hypothetical protein
VQCALLNAKLVLQHLNAKSVMMDFTRMPQTLLVWLVIHHVKHVMMAQHHVRLVLMVIFQKILLALYVIDLV